MPYVSDREASPDGGRGRGDARAPRIALGLSAGAVTRRLLIIVAFLLVANVGAQLSRYVLGHPTALGLVELFDFNSEENIPTLFSSVLLLLCAACFGLIAAGRWTMGAPHGVLWLVLAAALAFMAVDEAAMLHERVGGQLAEAFEASGYVHYPWVIPYAALAVAVGLAGLRAVAALPRRIAALFVLGGALYVLGALGVEAVGARHASVHGTENLGYAALFTVEELLEMTGVVVLIHAALAYLVREFAGLDVRLGPSTAPTARPDPPPRGARPADAASGR